MDSISCQVEDCVSDQVWDQVWRHALVWDQVTFQLVDRVLRHIAEVIRA